VGGEDPEAAVEEIRANETPNEFYSPLNIRDFNFIRDVGFPGEYPFTAGKYPTQVPGSGPVKGGGHQSGGGGLVRAGRYSGYGTAPDTRDYYKMMIARGATGAPILLSTCQRRWVSIQMTSSQRRGGWNRGLRRQLQGL